MKNSYEGKLTCVSFIIPLLLLLISIYFFYPESLPPDKGSEIRNLAETNDVVIIANAGGLGDVQLQQAADFAPLLKGIQDTLSELGYTSALLPYMRTPPGLSGRISDVKAQLNSFDSASKVLADDIISISKNLPEKNFIIAGFSNGGAFSEAVMDRIGDRPNVSAIIAGVPCWYKPYKQVNSLVLTNNDQDSLAASNSKEIIATIIEAPFRFIRSKVTKGNLNVATSFRFPGHDYAWYSPEVGPPVQKFLRSRFGAIAQTIPGRRLQFDPLIRGIFSP